MGRFQTGHLKRPIYHVLNLKSQIKLISNTVQSYDFDINEFNLTYEVQNMANRAFQIVPFGIAPIQMGGLSVVASGHRVIYD